MLRSQALLLKLSMIPEPSSVTVLTGFTAVALAVTGTELTNRLMNVVGTCVVAVTETV